MSRSPAQERAQAELSSRGGKVAAALRRASRVGRSLGDFVRGACNVFHARPAGFDVYLDHEDTLGLVLAAYVVALYEGRSLSAEEGLGRLVPPMSKRSRARLSRLTRGVERDAVRALRRLGGSWEQLYGLLVAEEARLGR